MQPQIIKPRDIVHPRRRRHAILATMAWLFALSATAQHPDFTGQWQLNPDLSDNVRDKMREAFSERPGGPGGSGGRSGPRGGMGRGAGRDGGGGRNGGNVGGGMNRDGGWGGGGGERRPRGEGGRGDRDRGGDRGFMRNVDHMTITHADPEFTLSFGDDQPHLYKTDGSEVELKVERDEVTHTSKSKASWDGEKLVIETSGERRKSTETYELGPGGTVLSVTVKLQGERLSKPLVLLRVYDRVPVAPNTEKPVTAPVDK